MTHQDELDRIEIESQERNERETFLRKSEAGVELYFTEESNAKGVCIKVEMASDYIVTVRHEGMLRSFPIEQLSCRAYEVFKKIIE